LSKASGQALKEGLRQKNFPEKLPQGKVFSGKLKSRRQALLWVILIMGLPLLKFCQGNSKTVD
jgi:hypothetical protein